MTTGNEYFVMTHRVANLNFQCQIRFAVKELEMETCDLSASCKYRDVGYAHYGYNVGSNPLPMPIGRRMEISTFRWSNFERDSRLQSSAHLRHRLAQFPDLACQAARDGRSIINSSHLRTASQQPVTTHSPGSSASDRAHIWLSKQP